jgi:arylsulfatase
MVRQAPWRGTLFTGYEGALRVPFAARWPGKIEAGRASDEIVHAMDLYPTIAAICGGEVPEDRVIDGIDMTGFLIGEQEESGREGFVIYMGNEVFGVKWGNWKLHFKTQETWNTVMQSYNMPLVYNLMSDPQEKDNVIFPHTWVPKPALTLLEKHVASLKQFPSIRMGEVDPYEPDY